MPYNEADDPIKICRITRKIYHWSLSWPNEGQDLDPKFSYKIKVFTFLLINFPCCVSLIVHLWYVISSNANINFTEEIAECIALVSCLYVVCFFFKVRQELALLLKDLSDFKTFGKPPGFDNKIDVLTTAGKLVILYILVTGSTYDFMKLKDKQKCKRIYLENGLNPNHCGLILSLWVPFDIDYFPVFQLVMVYGTICCYLNAKMPMVISFNAYEIAHYIILRLKHLKIMIIECFEVEDYEYNQKKLSECILYHIEILNLAKRFDDTFFHCMFGHFLLTGAVCACIEKQIVEGYNITLGLFHITGWIFALFVGCVGGQLILNATDIIPEAILNSKWYQADPRLQKNLLFMLMRSQKDLQIRAGPFGVLSYPLFVSIIKMSYSILCMLTS